MKTYVLTLTKDDTLKRAADMILDKNIGSVVIVDEARRPIGIVTSRDLLSVFARRVEVFNVEVIAKSLSEGSAAFVSPFVAQMERLLKKQRRVARAKVIVKEKKKGKKGGVFQVALSIFQRRGRPRVVREEGKNLQKVLRDLKDRIKSLSARRGKRKR